MTQLITITDSNLGDGAIERSVLEPGFTVERLDLSTEDEVIEAASGSAGILVQWAPLTERVFAALPDLQAVVRYGIGLDNIDLAAAEAHGVVVRNVDDYCLAEVADHAAASIYAHNRRLVAGARSFSENGWTTAGIAAPLPPGADPVGVAGFGRIGREAARRAHSLGFAVHVWDPFVTDLDEAYTQHETLADLASAVNHLTLHIPTIDATRGIVDRTILDALGPDGHLVNTARGALVDETDLLAALDAGTLGFASLDVLSSEPPVGLAAQIAAHQRVLVTPHIAYLSTESLPMLQRRAAEILRDELAGS